VSTQAGLPKWLQRSRRAAAAEPLSPRAPLLLSGHQAPIGSIEPSLAERLARAGLPIGDGASGWVITAPAPASLAAIARWLHAAGVCSRWRDELLPVRDDAGAGMAAVERSVVRALGIRTFAVHLVGSTPEGRVWVQQRAFDKATDPGAWDTLVGGLVGVDETTETALAREAAEEAGLALAQLDALTRAGRVAVRRPVPDGFMAEDIEVFHAVVPRGVEPINRDGEVERFECLDAEALHARLAAGAFTLEAELVFGVLVEQGTLAGRPSGRRGEEGGAGAPGKRAR
jgi:8-oxo-dGTP pyrophosphatase MutT (NUDIX family)